MKIKKFLWKVHNVIDKVYTFIMTNVVTIALIWIFVTFILCILYRYILGFSLATVEETYTIMLLYLALFGGAFSFRERSNTTFDLLYDGLGARGKAIFDILSKLVVIVVFCIVFKPFWEDILFYNMRKTSLLKISYMLLYMPFMLILFSGIYYNAFYLITEDVPSLISSFKKKPKEEAAEEREV